MTLKHDLLVRGYLPENLPPTFITENLGSYLAGQSEFFSKDKWTKAASYSASKRGLTRRVFSFIHPSTAHDLAEFISGRNSELNEFLQRSSFSLSVPRHTPDGDRALEISSHNELEEQRLVRLAQYRFVARTDISRFYHSIYTHSIPWALHGKAAAKLDQRANSSNIYGNRLDQILRRGQDGQTIGIPVGPDTSRYVAEFIGTAIDAEFVNRGGANGCSVLRHVDDVWIGANTHAEAETALWRYRESIRLFELDINEAKTKIYTESFPFADSWPTEIAAKIEFALKSPNRQVPERLRAALEDAFLMTASTGDDGILKYTLRFLDRTYVSSNHWITIEPYLMRAVTHYSHTIDYIARMLVWRHLAKGDLDVGRWTPVLQSLIQRHGQLGNDGEVCWGFYVALRLGIQIPSSIAEAALRNCGAMSAIAILSTVDSNTVASGVFSTAFDTLIAGEKGYGAFWPLLLEWKVRQWPRHSELTVENELIKSLVQNESAIFDVSRLPVVFDNLTLDDFGNIKHAIEKRSQYDEGEEEEEEEEENDQIDDF